MTFEAKCKQCGKTFEAEDKWKFVYSKFPDKVLCESCKKGVNRVQQENKTEPKQAPEKTSTSYSKSYMSKGSKVVSDSKKEPRIEARHIKKFYDMIRAEFADEYEEVKDYLGGWTTTLLLNAKIRGELDD